MILSHVEPLSFFRFFEEISQIPRGSGNEKAVSDYVKNYAAAKGYEVVQDKYHSLIIKKAGSPGYESHNPVIIQGHLDMVCEKNAGTGHDFMTDPIPLVLEGDILRAKGTTLGADNGVAIAMGMALLDDETLVHPPLEIVLTADEEAGMTGADKLDTSLLKGRRMINLDSGEEGIFFSGCAGGVKAAYKLKNQWEAPGAYSAALAISVKGLKGGHSGGEINQERGNSLRIMGRLLQQLNQVSDIRIASISGGMKLNAIPREAAAVIACQPEDMSTIKTIIDEFSKSIGNEYRVSDPGLTITAAEGNATRVLTDEYAIISSLLLLPNGVSAMSMDIPGLVETSCNIGVMEQDENETILHLFPRSSVASRIQMMKTHISTAAELTSAEVVFSNEYNPWEYNPHSVLREKSLEVYRSLYGKEPEVTSVHAGLECGIFGGKIEELDIVSFGPDIWELHTPDEHMSVSSMKRVWEYTLALLKEL